MGVSIALAVHNAEDYLPDLLESVGRQTIRPAELVVCDDASRDATPRILAEFAVAAPFPVRVERLERRHGHVQAFIRAARRCQCKAIAFCDQDDVWMGHKLELCVRELERSRATLVLHTTRVVDAELRDLGARWPPIEATRLVPPLGFSGLELHTPGMAMVFRREILSAADFDTRPRSRYEPRHQMLHDEWVAFLGGAIGPIRVLAEPLVLYRQHGANESGGWIQGRRSIALRPALAHYLQAAEYTAECAEYLESAEPDDAAIRERLAAGARLYRDASENWSLRAELYQSPNRWRRARLLRRLLAARAYTARGAGGLGRIAFGKDLVSGVAMRRSDQTAT